MGSHQAQVLLCLGLVAVLVAEQQDTAAGVSPDALEVQFHQCHVV